MQNKYPLKKEDYDYEILKPEFELPYIEQIDQKAIEDDLDKFHKQNEADYKKIQTEVFEYILQI